ncbi:MAG: methyltransferase domain-containing protein [Bacteriovoracaceae bacterium]|jgi:arsenite methyltransferase|nr:methyltransferase domain-containing protein [Bacteriovoracaceae bacterium]
MSKNLEVQEYYGKTLQQSSDLKTNACCTIKVYPDHIKDAMSLIHNEVHNRYYGCGLTIPAELKGTKVLDLGSGAGRDCFILSKLVGQEGEVVGVDITKEQLKVANVHIDFHTKAFGYSKPNTRFIQGDIAKLDECDLKDDYFDAIVSNCVINLCEDKEAVLKEAYRVLKEGGELYFSDVYSDRRISEELKDDKVLWGECLSGALYWNDFLNLAKQTGFADPRMVEVEDITIESKEVEELVGDIKFYSVTYRLFKLPELETECEDFGQSVIYKGTLKESPDQFVLDDHHIIKKNQEFKVCGNTYLMLNQTRYKKHFEFKGDFSKHLGIFEGCGGEAPFNSQNKKSGTSCC